MLLAISTNAGCWRIEQQTVRSDLYDGKSLGKWSIAEFGGQDDVSIENGQIVFAAGYPLVGITYDGEFPNYDYVLHLKAKKVDGTDFFCCVTFPVGDEFCSFVVGGWGGTVTGLSCIDLEDASENETSTIRKYELDRWYSIKISVGEQQIRCWIDDDKVVDVNHENRKLSLRPEVIPNKPLGICSFETRAKLKDIYVELPNKK